METGAHMAATVSGGMEASRDAMPAMRERARVMSAEMAVIHYRSAMRNIVAAAQGHAAPVEIGAPRVVAPAKSTEHSQADAHSKSNSESHHQADRNGRHIKARICDHQRSVNHPGIVIRNRHQQRIHRRNHNYAIIHHHGLLRRRDQHVPLLRRETVRLDGIHHVFRLVVIRVAELRRPRRILRHVIEHRGKFREALDRRIPIHGIRRGSALFRRQRQVGIQPCIGRRHLVRIRCGYQYLSHQRVGIKSKRRHQLIQLVSVQRDVGRHRLRVQSHL
jgi:hypothetical protein